MKATEAGFVALRLLGLVLLVYGIMGCVQSWLYYFAQDAVVVEGCSFESIGAAVFAASLVEVLCASCILVFTRRLSELLFGGVADLELATAPSSMLAVAFALVGVWVAIGVLPSLGATLVQLLWVLRDGAKVERETFFTNEMFFRALKDVLWLMAGCLLFTKSSWLARFWSRSAA